MTKAIVVIAVAALVPFLTGVSSCGETAKHENEVSSAKWAQVQVGMSREEIRSILGEPDDVQTFDPKDPFAAGIVRTETWYYGSGYQVAFDQVGRVDIMRASPR